MPPQAATTVNAGPCQTGPSVAALFGASLTDVSGKVEVSLTLRATLRYDTLLTGPFISAFFLVFCGWSLARRRARMARATHPADIADMSTTPRHGSARLINNYVGTPGDWTVSSEKSAGDMNELMA